MRTITFGIRITQEMATKLDKLVEEKLLDRNKIVNEAINLYLKIKKEKQRQQTP